jgi:hypothetical protein
MRLQKFFVNLIITFVLVASAAWADDKDKKPTHNPIYTIKSNGQEVTPAMLAANPGQFRQMGADHLGRRPDLIDGNIKLLREANQGRYTSLDRKGYMKLFKEGRIVTGESLVGDTTFQNSGQNKISGEFEFVGEPLPLAGELFIVDNGGIPIARLKCGNVPRTRARLGNEFTIESGEFITDDDTDVVRGASASAHSQVDVHVPAVETAGGGCDCAAYATPKLQRLCLKRCNPKPGGGGLFLALGGGSGNTRISSTTDNSYREAPYSRYNPVIGNGDRIHDNGNTWAWNNGNSDDDVWAPTNVDSHDSWLSDDDTMSDNRSWSWVDNRGRCIHRIPDCNLPCRHVGPCNGGQDGDDPFDPGGGNDGRDPFDTGGGSDGDDGYDPSATTRVAGSDSRYTGDSDNWRQYLPGNQQVRRPTGTTWADIENRPQVPQFNSNSGQPTYDGRTQSQQGGNSVDQFLAGRVRDRSYLLRR